MLTLDIVKTNFESWRANRNGKSKIPDYLWEQALSLIENYPIGEITKVLRLSGGQVSKKRREREQQLSDNIASPPAATFFEVPIPSITHEKNNVQLSSKIELKRADGAMVVIDNLPEQSLMNVLNNFMQGI